MKKLILSATTLCLLIVSCKKDSEPTLEVLEKNIVGIEWVIESYNYKLNGVDVNGYNSYPLCNRDDSWTMRSDGKSIIEEGETKCYESNPQTYESGTWKLQNNNKEILLKDFGAEEYGIPEIVYQILESTDTKLKVRYLTFVNGPEVINTMTYVAK